MYGRKEANWLVDNILFFFPLPKDFVLERIKMKCFCYLIAKENIEYILINEDNF